MSCDPSCNDSEDCVENTCLQKCEENQIRDDSGNCIPSCPDGEEFDGSVCIKKKEQSIAMPLGLFIVILALFMSS